MSVETLISAAQAYASTTLAAGSEALETATGLVENVGYELVYYNPVAPADPPDYVTDEEIPTFDVVTLDLPPDVGPGPDLDAARDVDAETGKPAPFDIEPPDLVTDAPEPPFPPYVEAFKKEVPVINEVGIDFPEPPDELINPYINPPAEPPVRDEPLSPGRLAIQHFAGVTPTETMAAPTDYEDQFTAAFDSVSPSMLAAINGYVDDQLFKINPQFHTQMAAIESQLTRYLEGGTGLAPAVETAIYERAKGKETAEYRRLARAAYANAAARGFTIPDGAAFSADARARQGASDNLARSANEIAIAQAEMEQKNLQFAVTTSASLRGVVLNATLAYMQNMVSINAQALEYAKSVLSAVIEVYNTAVKAYSAKVELYRAEISVFEAHIKEETSKLELYRLEIDAQQALLTMDRAKVEIYKIRLDGLATLANVYRSQVEAVQGQVSLEKLKLDVFQSEVQSYTAQVEGKNAEWRGFVARLQGQESRVRMFESQVKAYAVESDAYKSRIEADKASADAVTSKNGSLVARYNSTVDAYRAQVGAKTAKAQAEFGQNQDKLTTFKASLAVRLSNAQVNYQTYRDLVNIKIENAKGDMSAFGMRAEARIKYGASLAQLATANAEIHGKTAQAALSGMNTLAAHTLAE